jgi:hypothetical protein
MVFDRAHGIGRSTDWCQLCKEYQVGGFAAPGPCTNFVNGGLKMRFQPREEIMRDLHPLAIGAFRGLTDDLKRAYEHGQLDRDIRPIQGFTTPREQQALCAQRPVVEHRAPWRSPHNYGLAVKFQGVKPGFQLPQAELRPLSGHDQEAFRMMTKRWGLLADPNYDSVAVHKAWFELFVPLIG